MIISLFFGLVGLLGVAYLWIGKNASNNLDTNEDYFLMGRKLTFFPLTLTLLATQLGGGSLIGAAEEAYYNGWNVLLYPLGVTLGLFTLGMGFGGKLRSLNITTVAELFEKVYDSRTQRYIASALSVACMFIILIAQSLAARKFFVAIGLDNPLLFSGLWSILIIYTVMGGLKAVVNTDILQALFIAGALVLAYCFVDPANIAPTETLPRLTPTREEIPWTAWVLMPLLFMLIEQDMGQRCFAAKNPRIISFAAITAGIALMLGSSIAIYFGILAKNYGVQVPANSSLLIESVKTLTNPTVSTIFTVGIMMAVISTADSLLCSISSNLSCDFLENNKILASQNVNISKGVTLLTGLLALALSFYFDRVVSMLIVSYELSVCVLFVPIFAAVIIERPSWIAAYISMAIGAIGFALFHVIDCPFPKEVVTLIGSAIGFIVGIKIHRNIMYLNLYEKLE
ncbi:MAG: sodium:solute symporter family protein [Chlamydiota bacterium]|nr:sodium:solute symporter family protein [Chlamydiota bacterium]